MPGPIKATPLRLSGLLLLQPRVFPDERGFLWETYRRSAFAEVGITCDFLQANHSHSVQHTLRGMHFQRGPGQAKLISVLVGEIFDVAVDVRPESPTFGHWEGVRLSAETPQQLFIPGGFAHGFCVLSRETDVLYQLSSEYEPASETGFRWDDPEVGIDWPVEAPLLSARDQAAGSYAEICRRQPA